MESGDVILLASGGHGFEVLEEVEMIEVKQGPYLGVDDKRRFNGVSPEKVVIREALMDEFIPVNEPLLGGREKEYLEECIATRWISCEGRFVTALEKGLAARVGRRHGIAVANGSAALDVAVTALGIGRGDEVIIPTFTIISCAAAVIRAGAVPVLVDSDRLPTTCGWRTSKPE